MKANLCLIAVVIIVLSSSLTGCLGSDEDNGYTGPIDLVVYYDSTSGMAIQSGGYGNGHQYANQGVNLCFNFVDTTSEEGNITRIYLDPDIGGETVERNLEDDRNRTVLCHEWISHGLFEITLGAEDINGNTNEFQITVKIDMKMVGSDYDTESSTMQFDTGYCCEKGRPLPEKISIVSEVTNDEDFFLSAEDTRVTWNVTNHEEQEVASHRSETIEDGQTEWWDIVIDELTDGIWSLNIEAHGDEVSIENEIIISYPEGSEDPPNPQPE